MRFNRLASISACSRVRYTTGAPSKPFNGSAMPRVDEAWRTITTNCAAAQRGVRVSNIISPSSVNSWTCPGSGPKYTAKPRRLSRSARERPAASLSMRSISASLAGKLLPKSNTVERNAGVGGPNNGRNLVMLHVCFSHVGYSTVSIDRMQAQWNFGIRYSRHCCIAATATPSSLA